MDQEQRQTIIEFSGCTEVELNKAIRHFGDRLSSEAAINWILNGCPDYDENRSSSANTQPSNSNALVRVGNVDDNRGWESLADDGHGAGGSSKDKVTDAARTLASLQNEEVNRMTAEQQWANFDAAKYQRESRQYRSANDDDDDDVAAADTLEHGSRGRAGRPSPVGNGDDGGLTDNNENNGNLHGRDPAYPINLADSQELGNVTPLLGAGGSADEDEEMRKAIQMSLEANGSRTHSHGGGGRGAEGSGYLSTTASAGGMSRSQSQQPAVHTARTRVEQEDEDMQQALSASMADIRDSGHLPNSVVEDLGDPRTRFRAHLDQPIALQASSPLTSYVPAVVHHFYANVAFRHAVLSFNFSHLRPPNVEPTYEKYHTESPQVLTKSLYRPDIDDATLKMACVQRLFLYLATSRRSRSHIADLVDVFQLQLASRRATGSPADQIAAFHAAIVDAYDGVLPDQILRLTNAVELNEEDRREQLAGLKRKLSALIVPLDRTSEGKLESTEDAQSGAELFDALQNKAQWVSLAEVRASYPRTYSTYAALDELLVSPSTWAFVASLPASLSILIRRSDNLAGSESAVSTEKLPSYEDPWQCAAANSKLFKIETPISLDRYAWSNRETIIQARDTLSSLETALEKLRKRLRILTTSTRSGKPIVRSLASSGLNGDLDGSSKPESASLLDKIQTLLDGAKPNSAGADLSQVDQGIRNRLQRIQDILQAEIINTKRRVEDLEQQSRAILGGLGNHTTERFHLRSVLMWRGLAGRESSYIYVQSGVTSVNLAGQPDRLERWWRLSEAQAEEVSLEAVLSDTTGMLMPAAGSLLHGYLHESLCVKSTDLHGPDELMSAVASDNLALAAELPSEDSQAWADSGSKGTVEGIRKDSNPVEMHIDGEGIHQTEFVKSGPASQPVASEVTLNLRGGSSRARRSSISSDTGSVASTSRVRIEDGQEDELSDEEREYEERVELGFAEKMPKKGYKIGKDPGKVGGKPSWLNAALPLRPDQVTCEHCKQRMAFLLQINAPLEELPQAAFRTFYVYACKKASCLKQKGKKSVRIFRTQLPQTNPYYDVAEAEQPVLQRFKDKQYASLCPTCKLDHRKVCDSEAWNEWMIETDAELGELDEADATQPEDLEQKMKSATLSNEDTSPDANEPDTRTAVDAAFLRFQERLRSEPNQILRYYYRDVEQRAGPLWVSDEGKPAPADIQPCQCGSARTCEFQILSTLLSFLGVDDMDPDSLDFGTIAAYTCDASCSSQPYAAHASESSTVISTDPAFQRFRPQHGWHEEVAFVQAYSSRGVEFR